VKRATHAAHLLRDYPNALRVRAGSLLTRVPSRWAAGSARPVVLLPGVYETWHFLRVLGDALNAAGHPVHTVPGLGFNRRTIPESAALVARELAARDLRGVALVAHSKGGLIGKHLMTSGDPDGRVDRLVAVATPFSGSAMARWTPWRTMRAFLPGDAVIRALEDHPNQRITSIYPRFDPNIPEGSRLEGATNVEIPVVGHFRILDEPATIAAVLSAVGA
jgi:alpha-beta hydrolase superfamily lysophospholipase